MGKHGITSRKMKLRACQHGVDTSHAGRRTNLAFFKHASTSKGSDEDDW